MNLTEKLIQFDKTGDPNTFNTSKHYTFSECRGVYIELISWLKLEHKRFLWKNEGRPTWSKPHILSPEAEFTRLIPDFINSDETFRHTLKITGDKLYFSDEISEEEIRIITKAAFDYYNPGIAYF